MLPKLVYLFLIIPNCKTRYLLSDFFRILLKLLDWHIIWKTVAKVNTVYRFAAFTFLSGSTEM